MTAEKYTAEAIRLKPHHKWSPNDAWLVFRRLNGINFAKGKAGKIALALFFFAASVCFAGANPAVDSLKAEVGVLSAKQNEIKSSIDSISVKATEKAHQFYKDSFAQIQNSYSDFLNRISIVVTVIGIAVAVIGLVIAAFSIYSNKSATNLKNQAKEELTKIKDFEGELKKYKSDIDILYRVLSKTYLAAASVHISKADDTDYWEHFFQLRGAYQAIMKVDLTPNDLINFSCVDGFIEKYKKDDLNLATLFLSEFKEYMKYCEEKNKPKHLANAKETWEKLCKKFGGEDKINEAIKEFNGEV